VHDFFNGSFHFRKAEIILVEEKWCSLENKLH